MKNHFKFTIVIGLIFLSGVVAWSGFYKTYGQHDTVDIHSFPKTIQGWTSEDMPLSEVEYAILETRNVIARQYTSPEGASVLLLIVYSQNNRKVSHPPEVCYTGSGLSILEKTKEFISPTDRYPKKLEFQKLLLEHKSYKQISIYWFKVGEQFTPNYWIQQMMIAAHYLTGKPASSALIRISSFLPVSGHTQKADENIKEFAAAITPELLKYLP